MSRTVDLEARLRRINEQLTELRNVTVDAREEALAATEQLLDRALHNQREAVGRSVAARADREAARKGGAERAISSDVLRD